MKKKGICSICGCTETDPCDEGCAWANVKQTLCTACEPLTAAQRLRKRDESLDSLAQELERLKDEALDIKARMGVLQP